MAIVYRVETESGEGPYQSRWEWGEAGIGLPTFLRELWSSDHPDPDPDPHPAPGADGIPRVAYDEFFGFRTMTALAAWMLREEPDAGLLTAKGFRVSVYECLTEDIREGGRQCVFRRARAVKVRDYSLEEVVALLPIPNEIPG